MQVRKKTVEYEARQYTRNGLEAEAVAEWCGGEQQDYGLRLEDRYGAIRVVEYGDWILKTDEGFEVCKKDKFAELYEEVK